MSQTEFPLKHVGIILDGNRRWAKQQGITYIEGHRKGAEVFKEVAIHLFDRGVDYLSAFVFSKENQLRPAEEVSYLMKLVIKAVEKYLSEFDKQGIKITVIGDRQSLSPSVKKAIEKTEAKTKDNQKGTLILCFNYGGRQEIVDVAKRIIKQGTTVTNVSEELFEQNLYAPEVPDIDLVIRTSGEQRLSGFMLWRTAYSELKFIDKYWPDITTKDLDKCIKDYNSRQRRFGE
ncbi:di-trans,poly-cis-decaprenylcistransferase [Candidatus Saccharibacteria bacterium]|nr:di-trans,poly-cis-decaprenylcistransferase [Candidatus Saccharibacteria bacterium]